MPAATWMIPAPCAAYWICGWTPARILASPPSPIPTSTNVPLAQYTADIVKGEPELRAALEARGRKLTYYRHPYLHVGATAEARKGLQDFLDGRGYVVAPVTL